MADITVERTDEGFPGGIILPGGDRQGGWLIVHDGYPWMIHVTDEGIITGAWTGPEAHNWTEQLTAS